MGGCADTVASMSSLRSEAEKRLSRASRFQLPPWWQAAAVASAVAGAAMFGFVAFGPSSEPEYVGLSRFSVENIDAAGRLGSSGGSSQPLADSTVDGSVSQPGAGDVSGGGPFGDGSAGDGSAGDGSAGGSGASSAPDGGAAGGGVPPGLGVEDGSSVEVRLFSGGSAPVPSAAVELASFAAGSALSGLWGEVPAVDDVVVAVGPAAGAGDVSVREVFVHSGGGSAYSFVVLADLAGGGGDGGVSLRVEVVREGDRWLLSRVD